ncbi:MAG: histidine kinase [Bacteroidota bacterium]|nr:histidine kinase [Bacteroidota bacterium]
MLKRIYFSILILFSLSMAAQHPYFYKIDDEAGLPSNEVYELLQDDFGYMWIGCDAGLYRYDGFRFKGYTNHKQNGKSISYLRKDEKGRIWCKNFNGQIYRVEGDSLRIIIDNSGKESSASQFSVDDDLNLWVANYNLIERYDENGKNREVVYEEKPTNSSTHFAEIVYHNNAIFFTRSGYSIYKYDKAKEKVSLLPTKFTKNFPFSRFNFCTSSHGLYVIAEEAVNPTSTLFECGDSLKLLAQYQATKENKRVYFLYNDANNKPWLCTTDGVFQSDFARKTLQNNTGLFKGEKISYMLQDKEGNYWFSSLHNGIFVVPDMSVIRTTVSNSDLLTNNLSALSCLSNGNLLLGTYSGQLMNVSADKKIELVANKYYEEYSTARKIIETNKDIYISRVFLSILDKNTNRENKGCRLNARDFVIAGDSIYSISYGFFNSISLKNLHKWEGKGVTPLRKVGGKAIYSDGTGNRIYVAFNDGFYCYEKGNFKEMLFNGEHIYVQTITSCKTSAWLVTSNQGVLSLQNGKLVPSGLSEVGIKETDVKLIHCKKNFLFVTSNNLLYVLNLQTNKLASYQVISGINAKDITAIDFANDKVYLATNKGLTEFPINLKHFNEIKPEIKIEEIALGDSILPMDSLIILPYKNNNLKINFISIALRSRGTFYYEYRLKELDSIWIKTKGSENYALFSSLPPGKYTFQVRSINESGVISKNTATIKINIDSPFWQKWWFYVLMILLTAAIVALGFAVRIKVIRRRASIQQDLTSSQLAAINAQMNPHFMYNTLNSIQDLILKSDIKNTNYYLSRFSSLMRKILEASQHSTILLDEEIEILELYLSLEKLRFGDDFVYIIKCDESIDTDRILIPSIIIQPFIENAIKHGLLHKKENKKLEVKFELNSNVLICTITDNGVGRKRAEEIKQRSPLKHKSFATKATEKRLQLINSAREKKIELEIVDLQNKEVAEGTKVVISIPV